MVNALKKLKSSIQKSYDQESKTSDEESPSSSESKRFIEKENSDDVSNINKYQSHQIPLQSNTMKNDVSNNGSSYKSLILHDDITVKKNLKESKD